MGLFKSMMLCTQ